MLFLVPSYKTAFKFSRPFKLRLDLELRDKHGHVVLWFAILSSKVSLEDDPESSYAAKLVKRGSSADAVNPLTGIIIWYH